MTAYLFAGGGTGGHLAPGIAVAEELRVRDPKCRIMFVGAGRPIEERMLQGTGFEYRKLSAQPLRALQTKPYQFVQSTLRALRDARQLVRELQPDRIIGLGGYASVPLVVSGGTNGIPVWLLEQNALPGRANRWLSHWFPICITFAASALSLPVRARVFVTGNPARRDLRERLKNTECERASVAPRTLVILGGSQGSAGVNRAVLAAVSALRSQLGDWQIIHQTGEAECDAVRTAYAAKGIGARVEPFFTDIAALYRDASLVVSRSGATTLTELALAGVPAVLMPFPFSAEQHQTENARIFANAGAAEVVHERDNAATATALTSALRQLSENPARLTEMSRAMRSLAACDATERVTDLILNKG